MRTYYNEWDAPTAAWLRELGAGHHLPSGHIDTRSIRDVRPADIAAYDQCHFFAGIGGWPLALRWAGLEDVLGIWTGSPPCQPFSVAGKGLAQSDKRHLAPVWLDLVKECRPAMLFGEQVADAIGKGWLDDLFHALEREGYACGAAVLPACSVGAPHIRKRLFFGAVRLADTHEGQCRGLSDSEGCKPNGSQARWVQGDGISQSSGVFRGLANNYKNGCKQGREVRSICAEHDTEHGSAKSGLANTDRLRLEGIRADVDPQGRQGSDLRSVRLPGDLWDQPRPARPHNGGWESADWLGCRDGKFRPVEPGTQPLAHGLPARVGRLRGYGNAIVPQVAATFITEFLGACAEIHENL